MSIDTIKSSINSDEFEIVKSGDAFFPAINLTISGAGKYIFGEATTTIAHNLGYTPALLVNIGFDPSGSNLSLSCPYADNLVVGSFGIWLVLQAYADQTNLYLLTDMVALNTTSGVGSTDFVARYFLLKERIKRIV